MLSYVPFNSSDKEANQRTEGQLDISPTQNRRIEQQKQISAFIEQVFRGRLVLTL